VSTEVASRASTTPAGVLARLLNPNLFSANARACFGSNYIRKQRTAIAEADRLLRRLDAAGFKVEKKKQLP
jgi:hypothetical protein